MCRIFNCDARGGSYCCAECDKKEKCKNPCLNSPWQCGQYRDATRNEKIKEARAGRRGE